jgi:outer membrane murein-binding lipoprotein Lpp
MIELIAAATGATIGIIASGIGSAVKRDRSDAVVVVRLTAAVEHIAEQVSLMREEIKADRQELFPRINQIEQRITRLEAQQ